MYIYKYIFIHIYLYIYIYIYIGFLFDFPVTLGFPVALVSKSVFVQLSNVPFFHLLWIFLFGLQVHL